LLPKLTFVNGAVAETNFHTYRLLRLKDASIDIAVKFVDAVDATSGLGEPGLL